MGFNFDTLAISRLEKEELWKRLGLELKSEGSTGNGTFEDVIFGYYLRPGWYILEFDKYGPTASDQLLSSVSRGAEVMRMEIYESSNFSCTSAWCEQELIWQISHDLSRSVTDLQTKGSPPPLFSLVKNAISKHYYSKVEEMRCDSFFSIPTSVFALLTGFSAGRRSSILDTIDILRPSEASQLTNLTKASKMPSAPTDDWASEIDLTAPTPSQLFTEQERQMAKLLDPVWLWYDAHLYEQALSMLDEITKNHTNCIQAMWVRCKCLEEMKQERELKALLRRMTETEATTRTDFFYRSMAWDARGLDENCKLDLEKSKDEYGRVPIFL